MKIAFFTYTRLEYGGGVAKFLIETSSGLTKRYKNIQIDIITFNEKSLKKILFIYYLYFWGKQDLDRVDKESYEDIKKTLRKVGYFKTSLTTLKDKLKEYDKIYTTNNLLEVLLFSYLFRDHSMPPVIYGFHIPIKYELTSSLQAKLHNLLYKSFFYKQALKHADRLHVMNRFDENLLKNIYDLKNVELIYYPFDYNIFYNKPSQNYPHKWNKRKINLLWIGRLTEQKGVDDLINIVRKINKKSISNKIIWNIFGEGELKDKIMKLDTLHKNVHYHGYVENSYISNIMSNNDIFVSTSKWESFPYNLLEAQACGLPVVCYDIHGSNDIIDNNVNGVLVKSTRQMCKVIVDLATDNYFSKNDIRSHINRKFNLEEIYKEFYNLMVK